MGSIALVDSINPSTLIPALWLVSAPGGGNLASYTLGVFATYLAGGLVLVFGPGPALISTFHHVGGPLEHALQAAGGVLALGFALATWRSRSRSSGPRRPRFQTRASAFGLGAGIMAVELPTAFMYFGAISAILAAHRTTPVELVLLAGYNSLFVAPLVAFLAIRRWSADLFTRWIASAEARLRYLGSLALSGVAGVAGVALLAIGLDGLLFS